MITQDQTVKEKMDVRKNLLAELGKARGVLFLARRFAIGPSFGSNDAERVELALAEAMRVCLKAAQQAKEQRLYRLADSGIDGPRMLNAMAPCFAPGPAVAVPPVSYPVTEPEPGTVLSLLNDYRRTLVLAMRRAAQDRGEQEALRVALLRKIFLQLAMVLSIECKLQGEYPVRECDPEPGAVRQALVDWAAHATRFELKNSQPS